MTLLLALLLAGATPPTPAPAPVATPAGVLSNDPKEIARSQFIAFAMNAVDDTLFAQPPAAGEVAGARTLLLAAGRMKRIDAAGRADTRYGAGFVFRFTCEHGVVIERFTLKDGKITRISFAKA